VTELYQHTFPVAIAFYVKIKPVNSQCENGQNNQNEGAQTFAKSFARGLLYHRVLHAELFLHKYILTNRTHL